jgi:hypothetical protein
MSGGSGEIRTHERLATLPVFKTGAFNRSATLPLGRELYPAKRRQTVTAAGIVAGFVANAQRGERREFAAGGWSFFVNRAAHGLPDSTFEGDTTVGNLRMLAHGGGGRRVGFGEFHWNLPAWYGIELAAGQGDAKSCATGAACAAGGEIFDLSISGHAA